MACAKSAGETLSRLPCGGKSEILYIECRSFLVSPVFWFCIKSEVSKEDAVSPIGNCC